MCIYITCGRGLALTETQEKRQGVLIVTVACETRAGWIRTGVTERAPLTQPPINESLPQQNSCLILTAIFVIKYNFVSPSAVALA